MFFFLFVYFADMIHLNANTGQRETKKCDMKNILYSYERLNSWKSKIAIRQIVKMIYFVREIVKMKKIVREIVNWPLPGGASLINKTVVDLNCDIPVGMVWYGMVSWDLSALPKKATRVTLKIIADGT
jgi:hypothetical protein